MTKYEIIKKGRELKCQIGPPCPECKAPWTFRHFGWPHDDGSIKWTCHTCKCVFRIRRDPGRSE